MFDFKGRGVSRLRRVVHAMRSEYEISPDTGKLLQRSSRDETGALQLMATEEFQMLHQ